MSKEKVTKKVNVMKPRIQEPTTERDKTDN